MRKIPKEQIDILVDLQAIEVEGIRVKSVLKGIEGKTKALDKQLKRAENAVIKESEELEALKKAYRDSESDVKDNVALIERNRDKMKAVKTNKEYQALLKGIDEMKERNSEIEERMLEQLEAIDAKESQVEKLREELETLKANVEAEKKGILKEEADGRKILSEIDGKVNKVAEAIDPRLMNLYSRVRARIKDVAIAPVRDCVCTGCNMNIPPQMFNELQQVEGVEICPHCQRMIYWEKPE